MFFCRGLSVKPIQVEALRVEPIIATTYAVRVQKWDDFEDKVLSQLTGLLALQIN